LQLIRTIILWQLYFAHPKIISKLETVETVKIIIPPGGLIKQ